MSQAASTSLTALARQIERRQITAEELTAGCLQAIDQRRDLNAFTQVFATTAMAEARSADRELAAGRHRGPLHGIPISLKDLIDVAGVPTSAASRVREGHRALADAPIVSRLREAGAVIVGKCNLHEFAYGTTSDESAFGPVRNPLDPSRSAGGSSGGSAVSVMTGMAVASIGTDTGGSIRIPAAACGAVGLKPTYGEVSTDGVVPLSRALDHVGPITRTVEDAWLMHAAIGRDREARLAPREPQSLRLAVPRGYLLDVLDDEVRARFEEALGTWRAVGVRVVDGSLPNAGLAPSVYLPIGLSDATAFHAATLEATPERYSPGVRLRLELGRYVLAEDYVRAQRGREALRREVDRALDECDALVLPSLPIPAPLLGATSQSVSGRTESVRGLMLRQTQLFNLTGHPAIALPCGTTASGLPCSVQLVGPRGRTMDLLAAALACQNSLSR